MGNSQPYNVATHIYCLERFPDIESSLTSFGQVFLSFLVIVLSILVECIVRVKSFTYDSETKLVDGTAPIETTPDVPSPYTLASRFVMSSFTMVPLTLAFVYRIKGTELPDYPQKCIDNTDVQGPVWVAIAIFTILPFSCACMAWLRSLVGCVLVRFGTSWRDTNTFWPPCLPIMGPLLVIQKLRYLALGAVLKAMAQPQGKRKEDIELGSGEEETALVANIDGTMDEDDERSDELVELPPAYDQVGSSRSEEVLKEDLA
jgi:hypothetical protein